MPTVKVSEETRKLMESWRSRVEKHLGLTGLSFDQLIAMYANSKVMP